MENKKKHLDKIYKLMFKYLEDKLSSEDAKSTDFKAAHEFLLDHGYTFEINANDKEDEKQAKAKESLKGVSEEEILKFAQGQ